MKTLLQRTPKSDRDYVSILYHDPCAYCSGVADHLDHVTPSIRGGPDHWSNYTAACGVCNATKGSASLLGFMGWIRYEPERQEIRVLQERIKEIRAVGIVSLGRDRL